MGWFDKFLPPQMPVKKADWDAHLEPIEDPGPDLRLVQKLKTEEGRGGFQRTTDITHPTVYYALPVAAGTGQSQWLGPIVVNRPASFQLLLGGVPTQHPIYYLPCMPTDISVPTGGFLQNAVGQAQFLQTGLWYVYIPALAGDPATLNAVLTDISSDLPAQQTQISQNPTVNGQPATADAGFAAALIGQLANARIAGLDPQTSDYRRIAGGNVAFPSSAFSSYQKSVFGLTVNARLAGYRNASADEELICCDKASDAAGIGHAVPVNAYSNAIGMCRDTTDNTLRLIEGRAAAGTKNTMFPRGVYAKSVNARQQPADSNVTATAAAGVAATATLGAPGANLRHYIKKIEITAYAAAAIVGAAAPNLVTTTNFPSASVKVWTWDTAFAVGQAITRVYDYPDGGLEVAADNTATTIVCPAVANLIWRVNVDYYVG